MNSSERKAVLVIGAISLVAAFVACTSGGETYTLVTDCTPQEDPSDGGCESGTPYACNNAALPSDEDPTLICENGSPGPSGSTIFCCTSQGSSSGCSANGTCAGGEISYECSGAGSPSQQDSTLVCNPDPATGANAYCCISGDSGATSSSCTEQEDAGCTSGTTAYVCPSSANPNTNDPTLNCSAPTVLTSNFVSYCCSN